jgi:hypothetical protein
MLISLSLNEAEGDYLLATADTELGDMYEGSTDGTHTVRWQPR